MTLATTELPLSGKRVQAAWTDFEDALLSADYEMLLTRVDEEPEPDAVLLVDFMVDRLYAVPSVPSIENRSDDDPPRLFRPQTDDEC